MNTKVAYYCALLFKLLELRELQDAGQELDSEEDVLLEEMDRAWLRLDLNEVNAVEEMAKLLKRPPRESELRRILADLEGAVVPRAKPTPACRKLLATLDIEQVKDAAWSVVRHAEKTGDIPEATDLIDTILTAVLEDMKGAAP